MKIRMKLRPSAWLRMSGRAIFIVNNVINEWHSVPEPADVWTFCVPSWTCPYLSEPVFLVSRGDWFSSGSTVSRLHLLLAEYPPQLKPLSQKWKLTLAGQLINLRFWLPPSPFLPSKCISEDRRWTSVIPLLADTPRGLGARNFPPRMIPLSPTATTRWVKLSTNPSSESYLRSKLAAFWVPSRLGTSEPVIVPANRREIGFTSDGICVTVCRSQNGTMVP